MRVFSPAERRRRLAERHALTDGQRGADPADVAGRLVALHGTDPATVFLSVLARMPPVSPAAIEEALYERRTVIRMLAMRRTVFVVPAGSVPVVQASTTNRIAADQRARLLKHLRELGDVADPDPWLADVEDSVLAIFAARRVPLSAAELSAAEPRLKTTLRMAAGKSYETTANITSRVLLVLSAQGHLVRGRPIGTWLSQQYRWSLTEDWLPASDDLVLDERAAKAELARHWLTAFGPAPAADLKWWTGWTQTQVKQALADLAVTEVELAEGAGVALPGDLDDTPDPGPWVALLPALDPTVMGWADRSWFLGPHAGALFDTNGNAGPTIWLDGKVVGGWAQRKTGEIVTRTLADVGAQAQARIDAEAARVQAWLGPVRVIPRFRTPTERELTS
jgi:Winged helix DNA-binding domain